MANPQNPLGSYFQELLRQGYTPEQIGRMNAEVYLAQGKTAAEAAVLFAEVERELLVATQMEALDHIATDEEKAAYFEWLLDGHGEDDYSAPLARAIAAAKTADYAGYAKAVGSLFKSMRKRTPHLG